MAALPKPVQSAWDHFATFKPWDAMGDTEWAAFADAVHAAHEAKLGVADVQDLLIDGTAVDGAPDFLAGELTAGLEVGLRVLGRGAAEEARRSALAKLSPAERKALGLT